MSVTGTCQVCESARAEYRCETCGSLVCERHYEASMGVCTACARSGGGRTM